MMWGYRMLVLAAAGMMMSGPTVSGADGWDRLSAGIRGGSSASSFNDPFVQIEAFADWDLPDHNPWRYQSKSGYYVRMRLDAAMGWLTGNSENAFVASAGPTFVMGKAGLPVSIEIGCSPTILSRYQFGETDLGVPFQFTSHVGLNVDLGSRVTLGYRLQHMSNAGLGDHNPGVDLHCLGLGYRF